MGTGERRMLRTIAALSTPPAPAGLGVLRLSGPDAIAIASRVFSPVREHRALETLPGYSAVFGRVADADGIIDECVATVFRAPHSYTGEDVVELSLHGGVFLLQKTLRALLDAGAAPAQPGEFTKRAFLNGKIDLTGAEAVMALIGAQSRLAAQTALAAREGAVYRRLEEVRQMLLGLQAGFLAFVDYPDDNIPELTPAALEETLQSLSAVLENLLSTFDAGRVLREGIDTAIVGSPNVGKSTLMNLLAGCERSIVTPVAGTTRDIVEETVRLGDVLLRLSDTAGLHDTDDPVETIGVQRAGQKLETAALVLAVFDASRPLNESDWRLLSRLAGRRAVAVLNKTDLPRRIDPGPVRESVSAVVELSAKSGDGLASLETALRTVTGLNAIDAADPLLITERQRDCARRALSGLAQALDALREGFALDAVSVSVDDALSAILELTGERATDAVVDEIFASFCVGK